MPESDLQQDMHTHSITLAHVASSSRSDYVLFTTSMGMLVEQVMATTRSTVVFSILHGTSQGNSSVEVKADKYSTYTLRPATFYTHKAKQMGRVERIQLPLLGVAFLAWEPCRNGSYDRVTGLLLINSLEPAALMLMNRKTYMLQSACKHARSEADDRCVEGDTHNLVAFTQGDSITEVYQQSLRYN